jgi:O-antigen/teichoic acid export membrane protein
VDSSERSALLYDGIYTLSMRILSAVAAAALGILGARLLGAAGKGMYALPVLEASLVTAAFSGLASATPYYMLNEGAGRAALRTATIVSCMFMVAGAFAIVALSSIGHALWAAGPAMASLPAAAIINTASGYAVGVKRVRGVTTLATGTTVLNLLFAGAGFLVLSRSPWIVIVAWLMALYAVAAAAAVAMWFHSRRLSSGSAPPVLAYARFAVKAGGDNLIGLLNYRGDLYVVALLSSTASLGLYTVAVSAAEALLIATQSAAIVASPHIGGLDRPAAAALTTRCIRNNLLVALVLSGALFLVAPLLVGLLYGGSFLPVVPALRILLPGVVVISLGSPVGSFFTLKLGKPEIPLWLAAISATTCIALALLLVPALGIAGAAIASTVAYFVGGSIALPIFARTARVRLRSMLLPTLADAAFYMHSVRRVWSDGRRLLFGGRAA